VIGKRAFTLLEVIIVLVLLGLAAGVVGIRVVKSIEAKRFQSAADRLYLELEACHIRSLNTQADFFLKVESHRDRLFLDGSCPEMEMSFKSDWDAPCDLYWNGEKFQGIVFQFASTGHMAPLGQLEFIRGEQRIVWDFPQIFHLTEEKLKRPDGN
jgi:prepilin-type N-terminal cleavage/methylation domain-containing protein